MIGGDVITLLECQTIHTVGSIEHTIEQHTIDIEIRLHLVFGDVQQLLLHLGRIVETVIRLQLEVRASRLTGKVLDGLRLSISLRPVLGNQALQEGIDILRSLGHRALQRVGGIVGIAHQRSLLSPQFGNLHDNGEGVVAVRTISTMDGSLKDLLTQVAVVEVGENRLLRGVHDDDRIGCLASPTLRIFLALSNIGLTESCQIFLLIDPDHCIVGGSLQLVAPLLLKVGDTQVDGLHPLHLVLRQESTLTHELLIGLLQEFLVLTRQGIVLLVIDLTNTLKERFVERYLVLQFRQHRLHLLLNLTQFGRLVSLRQGKEHTRDTVEQPSALLKRQDGILESRRIFRLHNLRNVLPLLLDSQLKGWQIIRCLNLVEVGGAKGQSTLHQKRILLLGLLTR